MHLVNEQLHGSIYKVHNFVTKEFGRVHTILITEIWLGYSFLKVLIRVTKYYIFRFARDSRKQVVLLERLYSLNRP